MQGGFEETRDLLSQKKICLCTSETFRQALWSEHVFTGFRCKRPRRERG